MKKIVLTNIWGTTGFKVTEKKSLMLQVWKFSYVWLRYILEGKIFTTSQQDICA